jgi:PIN domain nuclease of toxin-antitoxin system
MRLLLDTHALLWWAAGDVKLSRRSRAAIGDSANAVFVSAASVWEVALKHHLGKLPAAGPLLDAPLDYLADQDFAELGIGIRHALRAASLPLVHRDPFDRVLVAQAQIENLVLVGNEALFDAYGVKRLW